jgi:hypothetical protein
MRRRRYLALSGALLAGLAGCSEDSEIDDPQDTPESTPTDTSGEDRVTPDETPADDVESSDTPEATEEPTPTKPPGEPDVQFGERELIKDDSGYSTEAYAEVIVENVGDGPAGEVTVEVEWYDSDGNYLDASTGRLPSLDAGEVWIAQVSALSSDPEDIDSIEISGEFDNSPPVAPEGMKVTESELEIEDFSSQITGVAENNREEDIGYVEAHGKIYDDQGRVIGGGWTNETDIPAGRNWAFEIRLSGRAADRAEDATDHVAFLDADIF